MLYGIIFWKDDKTVKPVLNPDGTLVTFNTIEEAEYDVETFEAMTGFAARVISLESV